MKQFTGYMFDTNIFNRILDSNFDLHQIIGTTMYYVTHIQRDEIKNTPNPERRANLLKIFEDIPHNNIPTESGVWDVSRWDEFKWDAENGFYDGVLSKLNERNRGKQNNIQDALIAETAIKNGHVLVTRDSDLRQVTIELGGIAIDFEEFRKELEYSRTDNRKT